MSAFEGEADMTMCGNLLSRSLLGVKRTWACALHMSAFDPKRTSRDNQLGCTFDCTQARQGITFMERHCDLARTIFNRSRQIPFQHIFLVKGERLPYSRLSAHAKIGDKLRNLHSDNATNEPSLARLTRQLDEADNMRTCAPS
jgi:hypothetical protein